MLRYIFLRKTLSMSGGSEFTFTAHPGVLMHHPLIPSIFTILELQS